MPAILDRSEGLSSATALLAARNQELLQFRDPALNLAYRICGNAADAEDILQDAYLRAVKSPGPILAGNSLRNWFFQVTANAARDWLRSERSRRARERDVAMDHCMLAEAPADAGAAELKQRVETELAALDEKYRLPISLHYEQGLSYEEAAGVLGLTAGTLRVYASQGIQQLREKLHAPARPVTAELLAGMLGAGFVLKASPALASSIAAIVAKGALTAGAGITAAGAAKAACAGGKPFVVVATAGKTSLAFFIGIAVLAGAALLGFASYVAYLMLSKPQPPPALVAPAPSPTPSPVALDPAPVAIVPEVPAKNAPGALAVEAAAPGFEDRVLAMQHLTPASLTWPNFNAALSAAKSPGGKLIVEWRVDACNLRVRETPDGFARMQRIIDQYDIATTVDYAPGAAAEATWTAAEDLMPLVDTARYAVIGSWTSDGRILTNQAERFSRVAIPYIPPEEYDFRVDFTRHQGMADINLIFPAEGAERIFRMCSWNACYFGVYKDNPDTLPLLVENGVRHTAIVEVRRGTLAAYLDGHLLRKIEMAKSSSACTPDFRLPDARMLGIGSWLNALSVHRIAVRNVTGEGKPLPPDPDSEKVASEEYWKDALDKLPKTLAPRNMLGGKWTLENGALKSDATPFNRLQIDYAPPEEYDYRTVFIRNTGKGDISQIVAAGGTQFIWKVDSNGMSILDSYGEHSWDDNPTFVHTPGLAPNGTQHTSVVCVRKDCVKAYVDGKLLARFPNPYRQLTIENVWKLSATNAIGVAFHNSVGTISKIQIKEVTGKGQAIDAQKPPAENDGAF